MPSEERMAIALDAVRPRIEQFRSALSVTSNQVRGMLSGSGQTEEDQSVALGFFAKGKVNIQRFSVFTPKAAAIEADAEKPVRAAQDVLSSLLAEGDDLFVVKVGPGQRLGRLVFDRFEKIGTAFAAARVVDMAKNSAYKADKHADILQRFPYAMWNSSERALAPGLVVEVAGDDFTPSSVIPVLDAGMKIVFNVTGDAPAAAMARLVSPNVFVQQETGNGALDTFKAFKGTAVAAYLPDTAASFVYDPSAGTSSFDHFVALELPKEIRKRVIGGTSPTQQAEDFALLQSLAVPPEIGAKAASDPAGKLSAWLLSQTNLSDASA